MADDDKILPTIFIARGYVRRVTVLRNWFGLQRMMTVSLLNRKVSASHVCISRSAPCLGRRGKLMAFPANDTPENAHIYAIGTVYRSKRGHLGISLYESDDEIFPDKLRAMKEKLVFVLVPFTHH